MAHWLMKSEPDSWSWDSQVKAGAKGEAWSGVRNHQAKLNLMKMKKGDRAFFYHSNIGKACGAKTETMMGLSGLGDLILTCSSPQSRNFSCGVALGKGEKPDSAAHGKLAEGVFTAPVLLEMAAEKNIEMPISAAVAAVLAGKLSVDEAIESLLTRPIRAEQ